MREFFPEHRLSGLAAAVNAVAAAAAVAVTRPRAQGGTELIYVTDAEAGSVAGASDLVPAWLARVTGQQQPAAWSCSIAHVPEARLWVVPAGGAAFTDEQQERLTSLADGADAFGERTAQLDSVLATLANAKDVRDVFDQVSEIGKAVLPHDAMTIVVAGENPGKVRIYAATGAMSHLPLQAEVPLPNQPLLDSPNDHALIADLSLDRHYHSIPATRAGMHAMLMMLNRVSGRVHSAVNFLSATPGRFTPADVPIARRIADFIGLAVAQQRVADEARRAQILENRTANLELLDELLKTLGNTGELAEVIDRISELTRKVLPHEATVLAVYLADGAHARRYVSSGFDASGLADVVELPEGIRGNDWDYQIVDDLSVNPTDGLRAMLNVGFRSALRLAVRLDGRTAAALSFLSSQPSGFKHDSVAAGAGLRNAWRWGWRASAAWKPPGEQTRPPSGRPGSRRESAH